MSGGRLDKFDPREYKAIIVDEVGFYFSDKIFLS